MGPKIREDNKKQNRSKSVNKSQKTSLTVTPQREKKEFAVGNKTKNTNGNKKKIPEFLMKAARSGSKDKEKMKEIKQNQRMIPNLKNSDLNLNDSKEHLDFNYSIPETSNKFNTNEFDFSNTNRNEGNFITPNVNGVNKIINNSEEILNEQRKILEKFSEVNAKLSNSEFDLQRLSSKLENDDLSLFNDKYSHCLEQVIDKLKSHNEELEGIKCNFNLKLI